MQDFVHAMTIFPHPKPVIDKYPVCLVYIAKLGNGDHKHKGIPQK